MICYCTSFVSAITDISSQQIKEANSISKIWGLNYDFAQLIVPVIVTITVFFIGQLISWTKTKVERKNQLKSTKSTIEYWIQFIKPTINSQIEGCENFILKLKKSEDIHPELFKTTSLLAEKLQQIELRELIETIILNLRGKNKEKAKIIFSIVSQIEFLVKIEQQLKENYREFKNYTFELMEEWNEAFRGFYHEMNETGKNIYQMEPESSFNRNKNSILENFGQYKERPPLETIFENLIFPMEQTVEDFLSYSQNKHLVINLGYQIEQLKLIRYKWETHKKGNIALTKDFSERISEAYRILEKTGNQLELKKFKWLILIK